MNTGAGFSKISFAHDGVALVGNLFPPAGG